MDDRYFDDLTRRLAAGFSRRAALKGAAAGVLGMLGLTESRADAQVTQVYCGNQMCASNPGGCKPGCVCCIYTNPRCRPPGTCAPGTETGSPATTTAAPATTSTTTSTTTPAAPTTTTGSPTTSTTVPPAATTTSTTTSTTTATPSTTTTAGPTTTTSTTSSPPAGCTTDADCDDGVDCTLDTCDGGVCRNTPNDGLCPPTGNDCLRAVCSPGGCTTDINVGASCLYPENLCITRGVCDREGFCLPLEFVDCSRFNTQCSDAFCHPALGTCQLTTVDAEGRPCDDGNPCTGAGTCSGGTCRFGPPIVCPADRPKCVDGSCVCQGNGLQCPTPGSGVGCCDGQCVGGVCCTPTGQFCDVNEQCCSRSCIRVGVNRECAGRTQTGN